MYSNCTIVVQSKWLTFTKPCLFKPSCAYDVCVNMWLSGGCFCLEETTYLQPTPGRTNEVSSRSKPVHILWPNAYLFYDFFEQQVEANTFKGDDFYTSWKEYLLIFEKISSQLVSFFYWCGLKSRHKWYFAWRFPLNGVSNSPGSRTTLQVQAQVFRDLIIDRAIRRDIVNENIFVDIH